MAASIKLGRALTRVFLGVRPCTTRFESQPFKQSSSSSSSKQNQNDSGPTVVLSPDGNTVLCWHPEPEFPYEYSRPMPRNETEMQQGDSALKVQYVMDERARHRADGPNQQELMKIFHTTRHAFDHKPRMKYRKPNPPKYRSGV